ncbi:MAG: hypothetical protein V7K15_15230 [Nostoc sp.]
MSQAKLPLTINKLYIVDGIELPYIGEYGQMLTFQNSYAGQYGQTVTFNNGALLTIEVTKLELERITESV